MNCRLKLGNSWKKTQEDELVNDFLNTIPNAQTIKQKKLYSELHQNRDFYISNYAIKKESQPTDWEEIFESHLSEVLYSNIKNFYDSIRRK